MADSRKVSVALAKLNSRFCHRQYRPACQPRRPPRPRKGAELRELAMIEDAALIIEDGRIVAAGPHAEIRAHIPPEAHLIDAKGRCVTLALSMRTPIWSLPAIAPPSSSSASPALHTSRLPLRAAASCAPSSLPALPLRTSYWLASRRHLDWMLRQAPPQSKPNRATASIAKPN